jgi:hypothetical protein
MAQSMFLLSVLMGAALVATVAFLTTREWRQSTPATLGLRSGEPTRSPAVELADNPTVWVVAFLTAVLVFGGATVAFVSGGSGIPESVVQSAGIVLLVATGVVAVSYLFFGTFMAARGRGVGNAAAAAMGSWVLGLAFIVVLVVKLMGMI